MMKKENMNNNTKLIFMGATILILISVFLFLTLRTSDKVSKEEAQAIVTNYMMNLENSPKNRYSDGTIIDKLTILGNTYKEGNYWLVSVLVDSSLIQIEVNTKTGRMEYVRSQGQRNRFEDVV